MLLRVVVFFVFVYYTHRFYKLAEVQKKETPWWVWGLGATALLFNPFVPAHLMREVWMVFNVIAGILLLKTLKWEKDLHIPNASRS